MTHPLLRFKKIHYYIIPLISLVVWWAMLIAMLSAWSLQGKPEYWFMTEYQTPVYISDIGATNLKPLFISCAGFQSIFFVGTMVMELYLRTHHKLQPYVSTKQPKFAVISIICGIIGQLGILFVSIFDTNNFHTVHLSMVAVFILGCFFACFFNFLNSFIFGNYPQRLSPDHEKVIFGKRRWYNLYMVSFWLKCVWLIAAAGFAICFGYFMKKGNANLSASFEWTISFWYGLLLVMWAIDLFPSAVKHYRRRHPEEFDNSFKQDEMSPEEEQRTISTFGSPTYNEPNQAYFKDLESQPEDPEPQNTAHDQYPPIQGQAANAGPPYPLP
ncbi:uncharacterized protein RJT20DRAFT_146040 [Scheffersomyces xylosifermentans]|uniref:uncharacterized protein n=1 Tax=Scheffersomyces xylosifermentans TaxID=1304137 RepID=UPI00315DD8B2